MMGAIAGGWTKSLRRRRQAERHRVSRRVVATRLLMLWVLVVSLYFLWEADHYTGLYAFLAEWQFEQLSHYFPILTFAILVIGFGSPAAWLLKARRRADRIDLADRHGPEAAVSTSMNFRRALFAFAGGLAGAALVTLLWTLTLPRIAPPRGVIPVGSMQAIAPPLGPVTLRGRILFTRTSVFAQNLLIATRGVRYAPIVAPDAQDREIRYFVELRPREFGDPSNGSRLDDRTGVLLRDHLPGSILRLYRYAGYEVEPPIYVLYNSDKTLRWPYYVTVAQLLIAALVAFLAALVQHRHVRGIAADDAPDGKLSEDA